MTTTASPTEIVMILGVGAALTVPAVVAGAIAVSRSSRQATWSALVLALIGGLIGVALRGGYGVTLGSFLLVGSLLWGVGLARPERGWRLAALAFTALPVLFVAALAVTTLG